MVTTKNYTLRRVAKYICSHCKQPKVPQEALEPCLNCGSTVILVLEEEVIPDKRQVFQQDNRQQGPI